MVDDDVTRTEDEGATLDLSQGVGGFAPGQVLGERYQVLELLGRGGMGEVWHAFDLKLRVEVALKALREDLFKSERRLEMLRDEVRAAREVVSPNVCRIFDLIEIDGRELVSMEYVDGATLLGVLQERGPLELKEAQDIASQFLAGLEAIHKAGLIHRDIKPENIMLTRAGRVVVMDFGLARQETEGGGTASGTPAYMAPEQAAGQLLDARVDVYAAGVVLAEMVSPGGIRSYESRQSIWKGLRSEPATVPDTPWADVIQKAVTKDRDRRFNTAHTLVRALEDVTLRVEGADDLHPYPGLASFTEADAEYFFGREAEVEQMWRKLEGPPRMLGLVGPSGAGKTSFVRAGLFSTASSRWSTTTCTPGNNPQLALGRAMARPMAGDADVMDLLLRFDDPDVAVKVLSRWRRQSDRSLLVVDQFEELFTQNSSDVQQRFADLLECLVLEADVHVLLSMRDDFMIRCRDFEALQPTFADLTALPTLSGAALRRALTQPALQCGYRFEDDELVDGMLAEVEGERGALPLLAFAAARLWEKRDRETGLLTRQAYHDIGGVGGALARHAESTIDQIGHERLPIVRELFRNLVTAEGTRAVREWNELLSVFEGSALPSVASKGLGVKDRHSLPLTSERSERLHPSPDRGGEAAEVLRELIDARLLTSYEVREEDHEPTRRVEIIHESLLANWPRLVRWQTQDADAAQLRDQLRQAAKTWDEQGRSDDTLWTGAAYREFASWRERYPGGLSEVEETFAEAMTSLATRRRHLRRIAITAFSVALVAVSSVVTVLWQRSVRETRRAEAQKLIAVGQLQMERNPTAAVAYAIVSLGLADTQAARLLALEALWKGPTAFSVNNESCQFSSFSEKGNQLVQGLNFERCLRVISKDGSSLLLEQVHTSELFWFRISPSGDLICSMGRGTANDPGRIAIWSMGQKSPMATMEVENPSGRTWWTCGDSGATVLVREEDFGRIEMLGRDGSRRRLGTVDVNLVAEGSIVRLEAHTGSQGGLLAVFADGSLHVVDIGEGSVSERRLLHRLDSTLTGLAIDPKRRFIATSDSTGRIDLLDPVDGSIVHTLDGPQGRRTIVRFVDDGSLLEAVSVGGDSMGESWIWSFESSVPRLERRVNLGLLGTGGWKWDSVRRQLVKTGPDLKTRVWRSAGPSDAEPLELIRGTTGILWVPAFHPSGTWIAVPSNVGLAMWPLARSYPFILRHHTKVVYGLVFSPEGRWLASSSMDSTVRLWPLDGTPPPPGQVIHGPDDQAQKLDLEVSPDGERLLVGAGWSGAQVVDLKGGPSRVLEGFDSQVWSVAFSPSGRLAAAVGGEWEPRERVVRVWNVSSGDELAVLGPENGLRPLGLEFLDEHHLLTGGDSGLRRWDLRTGQSKVLRTRANLIFAVDRSRRRAIFTEGNEGNMNAGHEALVLDLETGATTPLEAHGDRIRSVALDAAGEVAVTGDIDGVIRVGRVTGDEPHLLIGHDRSVESLAVDPLGRWIASGSEDTTVRLWPMPDLDKPPLHTLPREELITKLKTLTNLRVVRDPESATGWKLTHDPFPGWEEVPTW